ncbi:hypothetical protein D3C73_1598350 [compost metagenome]
MATLRTHSRNNPSVMWKLLALWIAVTLRLRFIASSKARRAMRSQQCRVILRVDRAMSGEGITSPQPRLMLRSG